MSERRHRPSPEPQVIRPAAVIFEAHKITADNLKNLPTRGITDWDTLQAFLMDELKHTPTEAQNVQGIIATGTELDRAKSWQQSFRYAFGGKIEVTYQRFIDDLPLIDPKANMATVRPLAEIMHTQDALDRHIHQLEEESDAHLAALTRVDETDFDYISYQLEMGDVPPGLSPLQTLVTTINGGYIAGKREHERTLRAGQSYEKNEQRETSFKQLKSDINNTKDYKRRLGLTEGFSYILGQTTLPLGVRG